MFERSDNNTFESYLRKMMMHHIGLQEGEAITFSKLEELVKLGDVVRRRFFHDKVVESFLGEKIEARSMGEKIGDEEKYKYTFLTEGGDFPELRQWMDAPPEQLRLMTADYEQVFKKLDQDLENREDWKAFWGKMIEEAGDDTDKLEKIAAFKEAILSSYRFKVFSLLYRNMAFQIAERAELQENVLQAMDTRELVESNDWLQDLNGATYASRLGIENPLVVKLQTNVTNINKLVALAARDMNMFEASMKTLFERYPFSMMQAYKQILTDPAYSKKQERLNNKSLTDIVSPLIEEVMKNDEVKSRQKALTSYRAALTKHIKKDGGDLSSFRRSLFQLQYADIRDRPTKQQFVIELLQQHEAELPKLLENQSAKSLIALQSTIGISPDSRSLYSASEHRAPVLEYLPGAIEKKQHQEWMDAIRKLDAYSPLGQDKPTKLEAAALLKNILAGMLTEEERKELAAELKKEFQPVAPAALFEKENAAKLEVLGHKKLNAIAGNAIEYLAAKIQPAEQEKKSPEILRKLSGMMDSTTRISGRLRSSIPSSRLSFRASKPKVEESKNVSGNEKEKEQEKGAEKLPASSRESQKEEAGAKASPRRAWLPTRASDSAPQRSVTLRAGRGVTETPQAPQAPQDPAVEEFKRAREKAREEAEKKIQAAEEPKQRGPGSHS